MNRNKNKFLVILREFIQTYGNSMRVHVKNVQLAKMKRVRKAFVNLSGLSAFLLQYVVFKRIYVRITINNFYIKRVVKCKRVEYVKFEFAVNSSYLFRLNSFNFLVRHKHSYRLSDRPQ